MKIIKTEGIVIGEQSYGESSKILKIFTKDLGVISVLSKGCKKPKSALREVSSKLVYAKYDISYKDSGLSTLISAEIIQLFKNIIMDYHDLEKKMYSFIIIDLTSKILSQKQIDEDEVKEIYDIMLSSIFKIDEGFNPSILLDIVMLKYLKFLGVLPSIDSCAICGSNTDIITLDSKSFCFVCKECYTNEKMVNGNSLKLIRMFYYVDISKINKLDVGEELNDVRNFIEEYYEEHTGIYFNIKKQLMTLKKAQSVM